MNGTTNTPLTHDPQAIAHLEKTRDLIDQYIDLMLNYRQSGHPGGSRSKVPMFLSLLLGGNMRWDIRNPQHRFNDRFILGAGHTIPMVYATFAVLNEAMRIKYEQTGDSAYSYSHEESWVLHWEDLIGFRKRGGLSGHAEMQGKTLFLKFNTGPSGHGAAAAAGAALALKRAGAGEVRVFLMEGEGGLTPGVTHEVANSAWGLALDNLCFLVDWNDHGIDDHPTSLKVFGTPEDWFAGHGWQVAGTEAGADLVQLHHGLTGLLAKDDPEHSPSVFWFKTRKGRGYLKYDNAAHGAPHSMNSDLFWETKRVFAETYGVTFKNFGGRAPDTEQALQEEYFENLRVIAETLRADQLLVDFLADRLLTIAALVPQRIEKCVVGRNQSPFSDARIYDHVKYPAELYAKPGEKRANREALALWGAWLNSLGAGSYGRPLMIASSADLAGSTSIKGFAEGFAGTSGYGWYGRSGSEEGALLTQSITEFANAGIMTGLASVNLSEDPEQAFDGFWGITSTYGSFSYLVYGMMRLYSQMDQDCDLQLGKVIYVASHSGPETADDSRTHFGIFAPGVTQLFPEGRVINLYPWEFNEVPVLLATALRLSKPSIIALHLTRPAIEIPDRAAIGMAPHTAAARGAYLVRDYREGEVKEGTFYVQGTSAMAGVVKALPKVDAAGLNIKIVYVSSPQLFALQDPAYKESILSAADRSNSTIITTSGKKLIPEFTCNHLSGEYAIAPDWDDRWRTGGTLEEVLDEARLTPEWIFKGIVRFAGDLTERIRMLTGTLS